MRREQFLRELKEALEGRLPESDIAEILADHSEFFEAGLAEGSTEEEVARQLGDPAKIALSLLQREWIQEGPHDALHAQRTRIPKADILMRLTAFVVDALVPALPFLWFAPRTGLVSFFFPHIVLAIVPSWLSTVRVSSHRWISAARGFWEVAILLSVLWFLMVNVVFLWASRGQTLGKWMFGLRVVDRAGGPAKPAQLAMREIVGKQALNALCSLIWLPLGFLPALASLVWCAVSPDGMTVWDAIAGTRVVDGKAARRRD